MTMILPNAGLRRRHHFSLVISVQRWVAKAAERRRIRREIAELQCLPDHLIRDMGLEHCVPLRDPAVQHHWR